MLVLDISFLELDLEKVDCGDRQKAHDIRLIDFFTGQEFHLRMQLPMSISRCIRVKNKTSA